MPANPQLVIEQDDGTARDSIACVRAEDRRSLIEMWTATATVDREEWLDIKGDADEITDRFRIERGDGSTFFEGRFRTDEREGNNAKVKIDSYERDAQDAEPTGGRVSYNNVPDTDVVSDALNGVPTLQAGTLETGDSSVSFTFAHASRAKQIRDAAEPGGQDVAYYSDRTVDFLDRLGSDKPGIVISSANQNYVDELTVEDNSRDPVTHVRGLGAQSGADQVVAEATIPSYSAGDRQVWREYENKDVVNTDRMQSIVDRLADEYDAERQRITVETTVLPSVDLGLGDRVTVTLPEHDIDRMLRCTTRREVIGAAAGIIGVLTNRDTSRGGDKKRRDDLGRFNSGDQGVLDRDTDSYGWQPVSSSVNATRPYPYPGDVITEHVAEVIVNSRPYRAYSQGAASSGGQHDHTVTIPSHTHVVTIGGHTHDVDIPLVDHNHTFSSHSRTTEVEEGHNHGYESAFSSVSSTAITDGPSGVGEETSTAQSGGGTTTTTEGGGGTTETSSNATPNHTHDVQPGLQDFPGETASNVDVIVNGTTVATDIGSGTFTETVDISGYLTAGVNTIELSSDSLGLCNMTIRSQLFRRGRLDQ